MKGRPRRPTPFDWLLNPPEWTRAWDANNLSTDEAVLARRENGEFHRREAVDEAFREGRESGNVARQKLKSIVVATVRDRNASIIANTKLSSSAAADFIVRHGDPSGLSHQILRKVVADIRRVGRADR